MSEHETPPAQTMFQFLWPGALAVQAIHVAARLRLADLVADGPKSIDELMILTSTDHDGLFRLCRALTSLGIFREETDGTFSQTPLSETLRADDPSGVLAWAEMLGAPFIWRSWERLEESVRSGEVGIETAFGVSLFEHFSKNPEAAAIYDSAMDAGSAVQNAPLIESFDFSRFRTILDAGGGRGAFLRGILTEHSNLRGILFDLPSVVAHADLGAVSDRCEVRGGDFFNEEMPGGADAILMKSIIHAFDDERAVRILENCKRNLEPGGRVLLFELVLGPDDVPNPQKAMMDLMMLSLVSGRERTESEFRRILEAAGFSLLRIHASHGSGSIVEAEVA